MPRTVIIYVQIIRIFLRNSRPFYAVGLEVKATVIEIERYAMAKIDSAYFYLMLCANICTII